MRVALCVIATNHYRRYLKTLLESATRHFCGGHEVTYFVFSDAWPADLPATRRVIFVPLAHSNWPGPTLYRYHTMLGVKRLLEEQDFVYYCDADMRIVRPVSDDLFGDRVAVLHFGFRQNRREVFTYETNPDSRACVRPEEGKNYFAGAFQGGASGPYLDAMEQMRAAIDDDLARGIVAKWHDESHWNRYCIDRPPTLVLSQEYCCPPAWRRDTQRIVIVNKKASEVRT